MEAKNLLYGTLLLAIVLVSGCASQNAVTDNTSSGQTSTDTNTATNSPTFKLKSAGCDNETFYAIVTTNNDYSGVAELRVYDNVQKDRVIATRIAQVTMPASDNFFKIAHEQQVTDNMDYSFCLRGTCEKGYCVVDDCLKYSEVPLLCNSKAACISDGLCTHFSCDDSKTSDECNTHPSRCEWFLNTQNKGTPYCRLKSCPLQDTKADCDQGYNCQWVGKTCITFDCRSLTTPDICGTDPRCIWEDSTYGSGSCNTR